MDDCGRVVWVVPRRLAVRSAPTNIVSVVFSDGKDYGVKKAGPLLTLPLN
jgi:hypothetical protein